MPHLPQEILKKLSFDFIKDYYQFRPRIGDIMATQDIAFDNHSSMDGYFSYQQKNGDSFVSTLQVVPDQAKHKVITTVKKRRLTWDVLAFASLAASLLFSFGYFFHFSLLKQLGIFSTSLYLLIFLLGSFLSLFLLFHLINYYQHIFVIDELKKYPANERWISIGEDSITIEQLEELKNQCIQNGIGLLMAQHHSEIQLLVAPAQQTSLLKKEEILKPFYSQLVSTLSIISVLIIGGIFYSEVNYQHEFLLEKFDTDGKTELVQEIKRAELQPKLPSPKIEKNTQDVLTKKGIPHKMDQYTITEMDIYDINHPENEILLTDDEGQGINYNCERFYNFEGNIYLVQYGEYQEFAEAQEQIKFLQSKNIETNCLWLGCFSSINQSYVVYYDFLLADQEEARDIAIDLLDLLEKYEIDANLKLRSISK